MVNLYLLNLIFNISYINAFLQNTIKIDHYKKILFSKFTIKDFIKMKKTTVALLITGSTLFASQNAQVLTNEDSQFIFGNQQANVQLLDQNEMSETKGKYSYSYYNTYYLNPSSSQYRGTSTSYIYARAFWGR